MADGGAKGMDTSEEKGIVYILTNPSLDGWIKIGMSCLAQRLF